MKKHFTFLMLCLSFQLLKAQQSSFSENINHLFEQLDFTEVTTGLLLQRAIPVARVDSFSGTSLTAFNKMDVDQFGMLYATLFGAVLDSTALLPHPDAYMDVREALQPGDAVPLAVLNYNYHSFRDDALTQNLFSYQNSQLYDVPNRPQSPYLLKRAFGIAPLKRYCDSLEMRFSLPNDLLFTNALGISLFEMDPDDGYGYRPLAFGQTLNITYEEEGEKTLKFRVTLSDNTLLVSHARFKVRDGGGVNRDYGSTPDETITIPGTAGHAGGSLQFLYDCPGNSGSGGGGNGSGGNGTWKPLLYIEGYEPAIGDNDRDISFLMAEKRFGQFFPGTNDLLSDILNAQGYDILYLDFEFNADHVANNAEVVKEALRIINQRKAELGSHEETVVIGASLGGVVGKYALRQMEIAGEDHDVKLFIALDAEFQGANLPVGMQFMTAHLLAADVELNTGVVNLSFGLDKFVAAVGETQQASNAPFLQEMLVYNIFAGTNFFNNTIANNLTGAQMTTSTYTNFQLELDNLGELEHCEFVAICSGAVNGVGQGFAAGAKLLEVSAWGFSVSGDIPLPVNFDIEAPLSGYNVDLNVWSLPNNPSNLTRVYEGTTFATIFGVIVVNWSHFEGKVKETIPYDNAPGGALPIPTDNLPPFVTVLQPRVCFVPTVSSLDITTPENGDLTQDLSDVAAVVGSGLTLTDRYDGSTDASFEGSVNQAHASLNSTNIPFLMAELTTTDNVATLPTNSNGARVLDGRIYNFGNADGLYDPSNPPPVWNTPNHLSHSTRIEGSGQLWVNRNDKIDFTDVHANPQNKQGHHFDLFLYGFSECEEAGSDVYIVNGGKMRIGHSAVFNTADVYVQSGTSVYVGSGGQVGLDDKSRFIVEAGGVVNVQDGGLFQTHYTSETIVRSGGIFRVHSGGILRLVDFSKLLVEPGGQLILEAGAIVNLWDNNDVDGNANIHVQGELVINGNFEFNGSGYFQFDATHELTMASGTEFKLVGMGKGVRFLKLNAGTKLEITGSMLWLQDGEVQYEALSGIHLGTGVIGYMKELELNQLGASGTSDALVANQGAERVTVVDCTFKQLSYGISVKDVQGTQVGSSARYLYISNSSFLDCEMAVNARSTPMVSISGSIFENSMADALFGLSLDNVENAYVGSSSFSGYASALGAVYLYDVLDYNMVGGIVTNNKLGIGATGQSNIDMRSGATVSFNNVGIEMEGGNSFGVLTMDCAKLLDNGTGVLGNDIFLNIDASGELKTNHFSNTSGSKLFNICYNQIGGTVGTQIDAKNNFWEGTVSYSLYNQSAPGFISCSYPTGNILLNRVPLALSNDCSSGIPDTEVPEPDTPSDGFTGDNPNCKKASGKAIYSTYWDAYKAYLVESYNQSSQRTASDNLYQEIASIPSAMSANYDPKCKQQIHVAKSRVATSGSLLAVSPPNNIEASTAVVPSSAFHIYPNPAKQGFSISAEEGLYELTIADAFGRKILKKTCGGSMMVDSSVWANGIYFVRMRSLQTGYTAEAKVLVQ